MTHRGVQLRPAIRAKAVAVLLTVLIESPGVDLQISRAQAPTPITPSGLGTQVSGPITVGGQTQYDITGGTRPGGGANLFHSFGEFGVPTNNIATFLNAGSVDLAGNPLAAGLPTSNILGRVTGGNISNIFGAIQTQGFGSANLFLMNPAGFLFGPNATVNVGGMVAFTSADYLKLADGARFNAIPNAAADALLTASPVASFGFLGSNPGAITVQGSQFTVTEGTGISLVGGNITIQLGTPDGGTAQPARLSAPNGKIQLASAASPGEFDAATLQPLPNVNNTSFTSFGSVSLASGSNINVTGEQTVSIRGGQFVLSVNDAVLTTADSAVPLETISLSPTSSIISSNAGADAGADVQLTASNVQIDGASIQSLTTGNGAGGNISITAPLDGGPISSTAGSVQIKGGQIQTASLGLGTVGNIQINSGTLSMTDGALIDTLLVPNPLIPGQPGGGTIAITATDSMFVTGQRSGTTNLLPSVPGLPTFTNMPSGIYSENFSANTGSSVVIQTPSLTLQPGLISSQAFGAGAAGDLSLLLGQLTLKDGGRIASRAYGAGASGSLQIRASDSITMSGFLPGIVQVGPVVFQNPNSNITSVALGLGQAGPVFVSTSTLTVNGPHISSAAFGPGGAGDVTIQAATISLTKGASIDSSTFGSGAGGSVLVTASEQLSISGRSGRSVSVLPGSVTAENNPSAIDAITFGTGRAGALTVNTPRLTMFDGGLISTATGADGPAGSITVNAGRINLNSGASISSSSGLNVGVGGFQVGNGAGGTVTVNATGPVTIADQGSGLFTTTAGNGVGGNIFVHADSVTLQNGGTLSAATSGTAPTATGGTITVDANQVQLLTGGLITAATTGAGNAGSVIINAADAVTLAGQDSFALPPPSARSQIISNTSGSGNGGDVTITAEGAVSVTGNHSGIFTESSGTGNAGNITIAADALTLNGFAQVQASALQGSEGRGGNIDVAVRAASLTGGSEIHADTLGQGDAGNIRILGDESITLSDFSSINNSSTGSDAGNAGQIWLTAPAIVLQNSQLASFSEGLGNAGNILLEAKTVTVGTSSDIGSSDISARTEGPGRGGDITIRGLEGPNSRAGDVTVSGATLVTTSASGDGRAGDIAVKAERFTLSDNGIMLTSTGGTGDAGNISIDANASAQVSFGFLMSSSDFGPGNAGEITITTPTLTVEQAGVISTSTVGTGNAGIITVNANSINMLSGGQLTSSSVNLAPEFPESFVAPTGNAGNVTIQGLASPAQSVLVDGASSGISTDTQGTGIGGNISVNANIVTLQNGGTLSAKTSGTAATATGGTITVNATDTVTMNSASITASSTGTTADAGSINITALNGFKMQSSTITTDAGQGAGGGNIKVTTSPAATVLLQDNSLISASVADGPGGGGNISIDPQFVILQNSQILARAAQGQGGAITITAGLFLQDANSKVNADSGSGVNGTVTIQSPNAPASGQIQPLGKTPLIATSLLNQHCAQLAGGEFSSFTVAGRDSLPTEPGDWLTSPLALATLSGGIGLLARGEEREGMTQAASPVGETPLLSLRQMAPPGFLTQSFAVDWSAGCTS